MAKRMTSSESEISNRNSNESENSLKESEMNLINRIECAIRHIQTATDVDPWAQNLAVESMRMRIALMKGSERKRGKWERHYSRPNVYADLYWHCSECGYKNDDQYANVFHKFCPNCGARMEGEADG